MTAENFAIDIANPLVPHSSACLGEAMSGTVYRDAYACYITNPQKQLFVPSIQWIDHTHVTASKGEILTSKIITKKNFKVMNIFTEVPEENHQILSFFK